MATALVARSGPVRSRSTEILCVGSFSIVVDSVDGDVTGGGADEEVFGCDEGIDDGLDHPHSARTSRSGSRSSPNKEEAETKIAFFKVSDFLFIFGHM